MVSSFDIVKLQSLLRDFYTVTGIRITVFDDSLQELISYPETPPAFCQMIRHTPKGLKRCRACDKEACLFAKRSRDIHLYNCHAGLTEAVSPIFLGNLIIGYLLFGHVFSYPSREDGWHVISQKCASYPLDAEALKQCCDELPLLSQSYLLSASNLLHAVASYLCMERMLFLRQNELPFQLDQYIQQHLSEPLTAPILCDALGIGKTYLYELSRQNYGCGIAQHIRRLRIKKAELLLLEQPSLSISEVAAACGFEDANYFITVFKNLTGITPKRFYAAKSK